MTVDPLKAGDVLERLRRSLRIRSLSAEDLVSVPPRLQKNVLSTTPFAPNQVVLQGDKKRTFTFDSVFSPEVSQKELYDRSVMNLINRFIEGYNVTILAYGHSLSGKSHTLGISDGISYTRESRGIIPRSMATLVSYINSAQYRKRKYVMRISFVEVNDGKIIDLLNEDDNKAKPQVLIRDDSNGQIIWSDLQEIKVNSLQEDPDIPKSMILPIDNMICSLGMRKAAEAPQTSDIEQNFPQILKEYLGGNASVLVISCVSPAAFQISETIDTLELSTQARNSKCRVAMHQEVGWQNVEHLQDLVLKLKSEVDTLKENEETNKASETKGSSPITERQRRRSSILASILTNDQNPLPNEKAILPRILQDSKKIGDENREDPMTFLQKGLDPVIKEYEKSLSVLENQLSHARAALAHSENTARLQEDKLQEAEKFNNQNVHIINELKNEISKLKEKEETTESYITALEAKLESERNSHKKDHETVDEFKGDSGKVRTGDSANDVTSRIDSTERKLEQSESKIANLNKSLRELRKLLEEKDHEYRKLERKFEAQKNNNIKEKKNLAEEIEMREAIISELEKKIENLNRGPQPEVKSSDGSSKRKVSNSERQNSELLLTIEELRKKLSKSEEDNLQNQSLIDTLELTLNESENNLNEKIAALQSQEGDLVEQIKGLKSQLEEAHKEVEDTRASMYHTKQRMERALEEERKSKENLKVRLEEAKEEVKNKKSEILATKQEMERALEEVKEKSEISLGISPKIKQPTFFNYPVYLRNINLNSIYGSVEHWCGSISSQDTEQVLVELEKITQLCKALCEYFLCHASRIDRFNIKYANWFNIFDLKESIKSLSQIKSFRFNKEYFPNQFKTLTSITNSVQDLRVSLKEFGVKDKTVEDIVTLIKAQDSLTDIKICIPFTVLFQNLWDNLVSSRHVDSMQTIEFNEIVFDPTNTFLLSQLSKFRNLRHLRIYKCRNFDGDVKEVTEHSAFANLRQISVYRTRVNPEVLHLLLKKSGNSLTGIELQDHTIEGFDDIANWCKTYCKNLTKFVASIRKQQINNSIIELLRGCKNLEYFHIYDGKLIFENEDNPWPEYSPPELELFHASDFLGELGENIPKTLRVIKIWMNWLITLECFKKFVERCVSNASKLKVMEFRHCVGFGNSHRDVIKKYL
ncbi:15574_t:CDS:2 [Acaulospora colombiana]|uniref:15574_t:CDS:1 n=1 Tax=Acaulospora colombiana TaxID=27376 RepID=A0ACA9LGG9_9GLOM|nr:15574_t:CDS:2 [Acaulospora colombiana]